MTVTPYAEARWPARVVWWLAPSYARPEARHELAPPPPPSPTHAELVDELGRDVRKLSETIGAGLMPSFAAAAEACAAFARAFRSDVEGRS